MPCAATGPGHHQFCTVSRLRGTVNGERVTGFYTILRKAKDIHETPDFFYLVFLPLSLSLFVLLFSLSRFSFLQDLGRCFFSYLEYRRFYIPLFQRVG